MNHWIPSIFLLRLVPSLLWLLQLNLYLLKSMTNSDLHVLSQNVQWHQLIYTRNNHLLLVQDFLALLYHPFYFPRHLSLPFHQHLYHLYLLDFGVFILFPLLCNKNKVRYLKDEGIQNANLFYHFRKYQNWKWCVINEQ